MDLLYLRVSLLTLISCSLITAAPNILLIVADDYGWNDIGYHNKEVHTPNHDKLANAGVKLESISLIC